MKTTLSAFALFAALLLVAGCGNSGTGSAKPTTTTTTQPPTADTQFIQTIRQDGINVQGGDWRFVSMADLACKQIKSNLDIFGIDDQPWRRAVGSTIAATANAPARELRVLGDIDAAEAFVRAAVAQYCPQYAVLEPN